jgi:hypothetical protein
VRYPAGAVREVLVDIRHLVFREGAT